LLAGAHEPVARGAHMKFIDEITLDRVAGAAEGSLFVNPHADYLRDHFPGAPMLPALLMLEAAVRTAAAVWSARDPEQLRSGAVLEHVARLLVVRRVLPGETFIVRAQMIADGEERGSASFTARGSVGGRTVIRTRFRLKALA
jgi:3-hydroxymyristoyl/3-hydroxydecanoyl-(acyl carrier protein) dehydratase